MLSIEGRDDGLGGGVETRRAVRADEGAPGIENESRGRATEGSGERIDAHDELDDMGNDI